METTELTIESNGFVAGQWIMKIVKPDGMILVETERAFKYTADAAMWICNELDRKGLT